MAVGDDSSLAPWEESVIARMEKHLDRPDAGPPRRLTRPPASSPGPLLFPGAALAVFGTVLALAIASGPAPFDIVGYILMLVGLVIVWHQL